MNVAQPIEWTSQGVVILDQRRLPGEVIRHTYTDYREVAAAIKDMVIRGAPAIGVAAAMGVALGLERSNAESMDDLRAEFPLICQTIAQTRPTAVDLFWAIERMKRRFEQLAATNASPDSVRLAMVEEARAVVETIGPKLLAIEIMAVVYEYSALRIEPVDKVTAPVVLAEDGLANVSLLNRIHRIHRKTLAFESSIHDGSRC